MATSVLVVCAFMAGMGACRLLESAGRGGLVITLEMAGWLGAAALVGFLGLTRRRMRSIEDMLAESEQRFQLMADAAPAMIWTSVPDGQCDYCNRAWFEFMGRNTQGTLGEAWAAAIHPDDLKATKNSYADALRERREYRWEFRLRRHDGVYRWIMSFGAPRHGIDGEYAGYVGMCVDITEQREAQRMVEESLARFDRAVAATEKGIWEWDMATGVSYASPRLMEMVGCAETVADAIETFRTMTVPVDFQSCMEIVETALRERKGYTIDFRLRIGPGGQMAGQERWFRVRGRATYDDAGRPTRATGSMVDITDERTRENVLREAVARYETLAQLAPVGIFQTAPDGACQYVNHRWSVMSGLTPEQAQGSGWVEAVHPDDRESTGREWYESAGAGRESYHEHRFLRRDGSIVHVVARSQVLKDARGGITGHLGTCTDVTAIKEAEEKLLDSLHRREAAAERENLLRRELDHRVRNNLASLLGLIRLSEDSSLDRSAVISRLRGAVRTMNDSHELISRSHGNPIPLDRLLEQLLRVRGSLIGGRIIMSGPEVRVAPERVNALAMALQELATNCAKHGALSTPEGKVDIAWSTDELNEGRVRITWAETGCRTVAEPIEGTGLSLLRNLVAIDLEGIARFEFFPGGMTCTIDFQTQEKQPRAIALNGSAR